VPFTDKIRPESGEIIERLHQLGVRNSVMLTGDNAVVARSRLAGRPDRSGNHRVDQQRFRYIGEP
jgi:5,10-methylenetetrahydrofolate reductase